MCHLTWAPFQLAGNRRQRKTKQRWKSTNTQIHKAAKIQYTANTRLRPWKPPCVLQCPWKISTREGGLSYLLHFNVFQYVSVVSAVFQRFTAGCGGTRGWLPWPSWRGTWRGRRPPATSWPAARNHASMKLLEWSHDSNSLHSDLKKDDGMNWLDGINIMRHITPTAAKMKTFETSIFGKQWDTRFVRKILMHTHSFLKLAPPRRLLPTLLHTTWPNSFKSCL